jgi:hypothetical protein
MMFSCLRDAVLRCGEVLRYSRRTMFTATCHCGAVRLEVAELPATITVCNCSICRRYAARWAYFRREQVTFSCQPKAFASYIRGDRMIEFCFCTTCGCLTHYEDVEKDPGSRVALNANMLPPEQVHDHPLRLFDGAVSFKVIE